MIDYLYILNSKDKMLQKDIEARIKDYPNLIKEENNRLNVLKTALANLNKTH